MRWGAKVGDAPRGLRAVGALWAARPVSIAVHAVLHFPQDHALADQALEGLGCAHSTDVVQHLQAGRGRQGQAGQMQRQGV